MDAKEWSKMADMIAQIRRRLYTIQMDNEEHDTEVFLKILLIREFLALSLEHIERLAQWDDKGWIE
jgi:hypothetical protein